MVEKFCVDKEFKRNENLKGRDENTSVKIFIDRDQKFNYFSTRKNISSQDKNDDTNFWTKLPKFLR